MPSAKILEQKKAIVAALTEELKESASGIIVDYRGLTVEEDTQMRNKLREAGVTYKVVKNSLTTFAAKEAGLEELESVLAGPTSIALSKEDPVAPAKILAEVAKTNENLEIKGGFLDGKVISLAEIATLASTPSRDTLIAKIMGSLNAPVSSLARLLQAIVDKGMDPADLAAGVVKEEVADAPAEEAAEAPAEEVTEAPAEETAEAPAEEAPAEEAPAAE